MKRIKTMRQLDFALDVLMQNFPDNAENLKLGFELHLTREEYNGLEPERKLEFDFSSDKNDKVISGIQTVYGIVKIHVMPDISSVKKEMEQCMSENKLIPLELYQKYVNFVNG